MRTVANFNTRYDQMPSAPGLKPRKQSRTPSQQPLTHEVLQYRPLYLIVQVAVANPRRALFPHIPQNEQHIILPSQHHR